MSLPRDKSKTLELYKSSTLLFTAKRVEVVNLHFTVKSQGRVYSQFYDSNIRPRQTGQQTTV